MNSVDSTESESSIDDIDWCILTQCLGCQECQNAEALRAKERASQLKEEIDNLQRRLRAAQEELARTELLRVAICQHFLIVTKDQERCERCGLVRRRLGV
jgi:molecular chaperone GrpE (heat shock protein)